MCIQLISKLKISSDRKPRWTFNPTDGRISANNRPSCVSLAAERAILHPINAIRWMILYPCSSRRALVPVPLPHATLNALRYFLQSANRYDASSFQHVSLALIRTIPGYMYIYARYSFRERNSELRVSAVITR